MADDQSKPKCPQCGYTNLHYGQMDMGTTFCVKYGKKWLLTQYPVKAFVCLECGFLGQFLEPESRHAIRQRLSG